MKVVPSPSLLSTLISPLWRFTISFVMGRPIPMPPVALSLAESALQKRVKTCSVSLFDIPIPVSLTDT